MSLPLRGDLPDRILTPALVVFRERVLHNVRAMIDACGGDPDRWRPHLKTTKSPALWQELLDAGVRRFKCATTREATALLEQLDAAGIRGADLLIAYPLVGPALARAGELARRHPATRQSVLSEDPGSTDAIPPELGVYVDVNPRMDRTGIPLAQVDRIEAVAGRAGPRFRGVHFYDGHLRDDDPARRRESAHELYDELVVLAGKLPPGELITSGTLTFEAALDYEPFAGREHRISPGTVVLHDYWTEQRSLRTGLEPAALVATRVVSRPSERTVTCDAGSKSIAAEAGDPCARVVDRPGLVPLKPSEEHLPLRVDAGPVPELGEMLFLVPKHVCPTVNLAERAILVEDDGSARLFDVAARAHDAPLD